MTIEVVKVAFSDTCSEVTGVYKQLLKVSTPLALSVVPLDRLSLVSVARLKMLGVS